ncbi:unnamed protein product [Penicillium salamii]|uniref:Uncharacterized protein n=1 Tax=Penicillium salamii TaxID=1612424 RepID=A0A9W4JX30_9EURO|nr:unnamed protein product [Penicillium salamii]
MKQGVKYSVSYSEDASTTGAATWQQASKALYPHVYGNSDDIDFHEDCVNAEEGYSDLLKFPILDGSVLSCGRNSKRDVGTDRVIFKRKNDVLPSTSTKENRWDWVFCGVMSHFTSVKVKLPPLTEGGLTRKVLPFKICKEPTTG